MELHIRMHQTGSVAFRDVIDGILRDAAQRENDGEHARMIVPPLIERKRDGGQLSPEEWSAIVAEYTAGRIPDYQIAALLMAVFMRGLDRQELAALTDAMLASGDRLSFDGWGTPRIDKHSPGGVGAKVSLGLGPLVAACGLPGPVMSGRGLGRTGGAVGNGAALPALRAHHSL